MIELGLIPESNFDPRMPIETTLKDINTRSPYNFKRQRVQYFERPEKIHARVDAFRKQVTMKQTLTAQELAQMLKQMHDDKKIH